MNILLEKAILVTATVRSFVFFTLSPSTVGRRHEDSSQQKETALPATTSITSYNMSLKSIKTFYILTHDQPYSCQKFNDLLIHGQWLWYCLPCSATKQPATVYGIQPHIRLYV